MQGLTLIFHLLSALVLVALSWWIFRLQAQQKLQRRLWAELRSPGQRVDVNWPGLFLRELCLALGIQHDLEVKGRPCPIQLFTWLDFHLQFKILSCKLSQDDRLKLQCQLPVENRDDWQLRLRTAMPSIECVDIETN